MAASTTMADLEAWEQRLNRIFSLEARATSLARETQGGRPREACLRGKDEGTLRNPKEACGERQMPVVLPLVPGLTLVLSLAKRLVGFGGK